MSDTACARQQVGKVPYTVIAWADLRLELEGRYLTSPVHPQAARCYDAGPPGDKGRGMDEEIRELEVRTERFRSTSAGAATNDLLTLSIAGKSYCPRPPRSQYALPHFFLVQRISYTPTALAWAALGAGTN